MSRPPSLLAALLILLGCITCATGQIPKAANEKKALTREQVAAAYQSVKNFGCTHAGYEGDAQRARFAPRYGSASMPGLPKDPLDYLRYIIGGSSSFGNDSQRRIWGTDRTWSSYAMRMPDKTNDSDVLRHGLALQQLPNLRSVDLGDCRIGDASAKTLAGIPEIEALFLDGTYIGDTGLKEFDAIENLTWLDLSKTRVTDKGMEAIARRKNLRTLNLANNPKITDKGLNELTGLQEMRALDLSGTSVELSASLDFAAFRNLVRLDLSRCPIKDDGLKSLAKLTSLEELNLSGTSVTGTGLTALASLRNLRTLRLTDAPITDDGAKGVGALTQIRVLHLDNSPPPEGKSSKGPSPVQIGDTGLAALGGCRSLRELNLARTNIKGKGFEGFAQHAYLRDIDLEGSTINASAFVEIRQIPNVRSLNLARTGITGDGLHLLAEMPLLTRLNLEDSKANDSGMTFVFRLVRLRELNLQGTAITSAGVKLLGDNSLVYLNLAKTKVDGEAFKTIAAIKALRTLYVFSSGLAAGGPNQFRATLPECTVVTQPPPKPAARQPDLPPRLPIES